MQLLRKMFTACRSAAWSAVLLGLADALLAALVAKAAAGVTPGPEGESARELRDLAVESLSADADRLKARFEGFQKDIGRARSAISSVSSGAAGLLPGVSSVVSLLTSALKRKK